VSLASAAVSIAFLFSTRLGTSNGAASRCRPAKGGPLGPAVRSAAHRRYARRASFSRRRKRAGRRRNSRNHGGGGSNAGTMTAPLPRLCLSVLHSFAATSLRLLPLLPEKYVNAIFSYLALSKLRGGAASIFSRGREMSITTTPSSSGTHGRLRSSRSTPLQDASRSDEPSA